MFGVMYKERNTKFSYYGEYIIYLAIISSGNKVVSQMQAPLAARHEPAGTRTRPLNVLYVFERNIC